MLMSRSLNKVKKYVQMSCLLMVLSVPVLFVAGTPVYLYVKSQGKMIIAKGSPNYLDEYSPTTVDNKYPETDIRLVDNNINPDIDISPEEYSGKNIDINIEDIQIPALGTQYGAIYCSRIGLRVPLYYGDDYKTLDKGAGQYEMSGFPGIGKTILISGHSNTFFAPLEQLEKGDIVNIVTDYGSYNYKVNSIKIADSSDTRAYDLDLYDEQLILYTCYPFGKLIGEEDERIFYYCSPIG